MNLILSSNKGIPDVTQEDLDHISPLHQIIAKELIAAGKLHLIKDSPQE